MGRTGGRRGTKTVPGAALGAIACALDAVDAGDLDSAQTDAMVLLQQPRKVGFVDGRSVPPPPGSRTDGRRHQSDDARRRHHRCRRRWRRLRNAQRRARQGAALRRRGDRDGVRRSRPGGYVRAKGRNLHPSLQDPDARGGFPARGHHLRPQHPHRRHRDGGAQQLRGRLHRGPPSLPPPRSAW